MLLLWTSYENSQAPISKYKEEPVGALPGAEQEHTISPTKCLKFFSPSSVMPDRNCNLGITLELQKLYFKTINGCKYITLRVVIYSEEELIQSDFHLLISK